VADEFRNTIEMNLYYFGNIRVVDAFFT